MSTNVKTALLLLAAILLVSMASAQSFVGGVRGLVQDPGGAVIASANVSMRNDATGTMRTSTSNAQGEYVFSQVEPATYTLVVESPGFKKLERRSVVIGTQQQLNLDLKMELGEVSQSVEVTSAVPLIENATASNGQVLNTQQITDLPNLGRNTFLMSKLSNNVVPSGPPQWNRFQDQIGSSNLSIGGGPIRGNNYLIDGVPITSSQNLAIIIPSQSAVQEMKLQENTYDASMGRTAGGVFNTLISSGTNSIHGELLGYLRTTDLTANNYFNNAANIVRPDEKWENWASNLGGPVVIPKLYNGRNKTFFFVATEGYLEGQPASGSYAVPTAAELGGDFSKAGKVIYDPLSGRPCQPTDNCPAGATVIRTPFGSNVINPQQINKVGQAILGYLPSPNFNLSSPIGNKNFQGTDSLLNHAEEFVYKLEHDPTNWLRFNGSFLYYKSHEPGGNTLTTLPGSGSYLLDRHVDATAVNAIVTLNPTTVLTARFGFNRFPNIYNYVSQGFDQTKLGLPASYVNGQQVQEFPGITLSQSGSSFGGGTRQNIDYWSRNFSVSASKFAGKHNMTYGFDYRLIHTDGIQFPSGPGAFSFNGIFSQQFNAGTNGTGSDIADILLGYPSSGSVQTSSHVAYFVNYYSGFFQDDIRVNNKLTVNVGLRYEYESGETEKNQNMLVGFNRTALNPIQASLPAGSGVLANGLPLIAGNGNPTACCNALKDKFGPRLGFAYQINDKTTFRGGWGMFYAPVYFGLDSQYSPGLAQTTTYLASADGNATPAGSLYNPFPNGIIQPATIQQGILQQLGGTTTFPDQSRTQGRVQQFSADIQRQLPWGVAFEIGYIGSRSVQLQYGSTGTTYLQINQVPTQYLSMGSALTSKVANPFYKLPNVGGVLAASTVSQAQLLMPYPEYQLVQDATNGGKAQYDSLIMKAQKRMSKGLTFLSTFTWSKNMDNTFGAGGSNYFNTYAGSTPSSNPQNVYNLAAEWAYGAGTTPWRSTAGWTYELPLGKGKPWLNNNQALNYAVGGWSLNGTMIVSSGFPLFVYQANNNSAIGAQVQRPNATGVSPAVGGSPEDRVGGYINPAAFSLAPAYTFGNLARSINYLGPGMVNWDLSLFKTVTIRERFHAQFRAEALNAFNTPDFANPNTQFQGFDKNGKLVGSFGQLLYQANLPRELQLGIRLYF
ncbi:MAG TPA: TonB-dependent receptor [Bryobacteraceae bacterium]|nr:TonB-dependent receptor [Bryobacteraceae bacterium]